MKRWIMAGMVAVLAAGGAAGASDEDPNGFSQCEYAHNSPHYGATRNDPNDPASWVTEGDPDNPWVGSTSPTGAVYAGRFGGSEGNALLTVGSCLEYQGAGSHGGVSEASVYEEDGQVYVVAVAEGGNDDAGSNGYIGLNTGYDRGSGKVNKGGKTCAGQRSGANACTPVDTPLMCEPASSAGGPPTSSGGANWHDTNKDGCDLRN
jgi:hypothetical protein